MASNLFAAEAGVLAPEPESLKAALDHFSECDPLIFDIISDRVRAAARCTSQAEKGIALLALIGLRRMIDCNGELRVP